ncbi:probable glutathione peroxidase 8 [Erpetoichthys calabaricus]|uniref:probable glutathione peroxidase 8 n=1 Tax=Erpetoichthys calabaricus TaxID=27687 RepID=UPI0022344E89|nr:probable glutathione peroxidase 8 [Erpetoichthys calabaricus]
MEPQTPPIPLKPSVPKARMFAVLLTMTICTAGLFLLQNQLTRARKPKDFYSYEVKDIRGRSVSLEKYRGKASLIVNVASHCEHTERNYKGLQELYRSLGPSLFTVLAFPCGQFGDTEPGSDRDIEAFAKANYGVTFPLFSKIKIMGTEASPAFQYITDSTKQLPKWNFWKYLINPQGQVIKFWRPDEPFENIKQEVAAMVREIILKKKEEL